ncbi:YobI family P-loop NTPase [Lactobacillus amylovorus]|uniref:YobI family P-loop NTPase n=1 Tax=Lactobacillus amylovorus TaxID=1604 RepID=UPI003F8ABE7F
MRGYNFVVRKINSVKEEFLFSPKLLSEIKDYEFINIPNFFETKDKESDSPDLKDPKNDSNDLEVQLEKNIIEQLLYKTNTKKYPDSNLKRLKKRLSNLLCK